MAHLRLDQQVRPHSLWHNIILHWIVCLRMLQCFTSLRRETIYNDIQAGSLIKMFTFLKILSFVPQTELSRYNFSSDGILIAGWGEWATMWGLLCTMHVHAMWHVSQVWSASLRESKRSRTWMCICCVKPNEHLTTSSNTSCRHFTFELHDSVGSDLHGLLVQIHLQWKPLT